MYGCVELVWFGLVWLDEVTRRLTNIMETTVGKTQ